MKEGKTGKERGNPSVGPHLWEMTAVRDFIWIGLIVLIVVIAFHLKSILLPVFLGLLLAYLFNPLVNFAKKRVHIPRQVTILFILIIVAAIVIAASIQRF